MSERDDQDYYAARAAVSRNTAQRAATPAIAAIHVELASRYEILAARSHRQNDVVTTTIQAT